MMSPRWSPLTKQIVVIGSVITLVWLLSRFSDLLAPLVVAVILAYFLNIPVHWLVRQTGWPRTAVVIGAYITFLVLLILAPALLTPRFVALMRELAASLADVAEGLARQSQQPIQVMSGVEIRLGMLYSQLSGALQTLLSPAASGALTIVVRIASSLLWLGFILVVSFWLVLDHALLTRYMIERTPPAYRGEIVRLGQELSKVWDGFVRGQITVGIVLGMVLSSLLWVIGMRSALALGMLAGASELIPTIGPAIAGTLAILVALTQGSTYLTISKFGFATLVLVLYLLVFQINDIFLVPRVVGRRVRLHPLVVFVGLLAGAQIGGVLGILMASPTIASLRVIASYGVAKLLDQEPFEPALAPPDPQAQWRGLLRGHPVEVLLFDLDGTLVETDDVIVAQWALRLAPFKHVIPALQPDRLARWLLGHMEGPMNLFITLLDRIAWEERVLAWADRINRRLAHRPPEAFVAVLGAHETIRHLHERYRLGIITTRRLAEARAFINQEGLEDCFDIIVARDTYPLLKPHPGPILHAAQVLGVEVDHCAMVGDTVVDVMAAQAAGALAIGVLSGFGLRDSLERADLVLDSVFDLLEWM
jgi:predicted PurR-regulated permease PerM/phosphoglycolate phosphatase-like HAD superfamily hydrolase